MDDLIIEREANPVARFSIADRMFVERGTKADWDLLHDLHYKAENLPVGGPAPETPEGDG